MILIGSRALKIRLSDALPRQPKDFDFICSELEYNQWMDKNAHKINSTKIYSSGNKNIVEGDVNVEFEIIGSNQSTEMFDELVRQDKETIHTSMGMIPNLDLLFTLKTSHRFLKNSPHFWKTFKDWHTLKAFSCEVRPEYQEFLKMREKETYAAQKHPNLNQSKDNFFSMDDVPYIYDHDTIHESQKFFDKPAYKYYARDGSDVFSDKQKFFDAPYEIKMAGAIEEISVLALERSKIPFPNGLTNKKAWLYSYSKAASSITSGFFKEWIYSNGIDVIKNYPENYVEKFENGLKSGVVKKVSHLSSQVVKKSDPMTNNNLIVGI